MGELIYLDQRRTRHSRPVSTPQPTFFFDVACPLSYLTAERIERTIGRAEWVPVSAAAVHADRDFEAVRTRARALPRRTGGRLKARSGILGALRRFWRIAD